MARRKSRGFKRSAKSYFKSYKRSVRREGSTSNLVTTAVAAAIYGAARPYVEAKIQPLTSKIPAGGYADEVVLGAAGYLLATGKMPMLKGKVARSAGKAILIIEAARVGSGIGSTMLR